MLQLVVPNRSYYDEEREEFIYIKGATLQMEHSLVSVSKWESKWHKPFLSKEQKTPEQLRDYYRCMTLTQNVDPDVYFGIFGETEQKILKYIEDPMTATWFAENGSSSSKVVTNEVIYYWMTAFNIPFECQKWHLNRLLTLIHVCSEKSAPSKKMGRAETARRNQSLNAARRKAMNSKG